MEARDRDFEGIGGRVLHECEGVGQSKVVGAQSQYRVGMRQADGRNRITQAPVKFADTHVELLATGHRMLPVPRCREYLCNCARAFN